MRLNPPAERVHRAADALRERPDMRRSVPFRKDLFQFLREHEDVRLILRMIDEQNAPGVRVHLDLTHKRKRADARREELCRLLRQIRRPIPPPPR